MNHSEQNRILSDLLQMAEVPTPEMPAVSFPPSESPDPDPAEALPVLDLDGFQVVRREFFAHLSEPSVTFNDCRFYVNAACLQRFPDVSCVQVLVNQKDKILALMPCPEGARDSFAWCSNSNGKRKPKQITCKLFMRNVLFANALLSLRDKAPLLFSAIFSGKLATTHNDALTLSQMSAEELWRTYQFFQTTRSRNLSYRRLRKVLSTAPQNPPQITQVSSIKDMPAYDPDAEITGLTLTIPSWTSSLARVCKTANLNIVSASARRKLEDTLIDMQNQIFEMLSAIRRN